jgi:hypothetical protein
MDHARRWRDASGMAKADKSRRPHRAPRRRRRTPGAGAGPGFWMALVRAAALGMAVAAEPSWAAGQWVALVGATAMLGIALGLSPDTVMPSARPDRE